MPLERLSRSVFGVLGEVGSGGAADILRVKCGHGLLFVDLVKSPFVVRPVYPPCTCLGGHIILLLHSVGLESINGTFGWLRKHQWHISVG